MNIEECTFSLQPKKLYFQKRRRSNVNTARRKVQDIGGPILILHADRILIIHALALRSLEKHETDIKSQLSKATKETRALVILHL